MEFLQYLIYLFLVFVQLLHVIGGQSVGTPTNATVCNGRTTTLMCDITQTGGVNPAWRVFTTADTSGSLVTSLTSGDNIPPYNYPAIQAGDTVARLEVNTSSSIDGYHFQCRLDLTSPVTSPNTGTITVIDTPSCPTSCTETESRNEDFTTVSVSCQQPPNTPPVTSTTVTYCPTSSPNCGNSMNCTTSPCTISGLIACEDYQLTIVPTNNCGSPNGCTGNSVISEGQDVPSCASEVQATSSLVLNLCSVSLSWQQPPNTPPITSTTVTYCPTSSPNCSDSMTCTTNPCTISGLPNNTEYQFTVIPNNNCGNATGCTGNMATVTTLRTCDPPAPPPTPPGPSTLVIIIIVVIVVIIILIAIIIAVVFIVICCCCAAVSAWLIATCCCCCKQANKNRNKPERFNQPQDEYADPKKVREKKEKEEKITYCALEFSEQAGSTGEKKIHSKEEPVQYSAVEQA